MPKRCLRLIGKNPLKFLRDGESAIISVRYLKTKCRTFFEGLGLLNLPFSDPCALIRFIVSRQPGESLKGRTTVLLMSSYGPYSFDLRPLPITIPNAYLRKFRLPRLKSRAVPRGGMRGLTFSPVLENSRKNQVQLDNLSSVGK